MSSVSATGTKNSLELVDSSIGEVLLYMNSALKFRVCWWSGVEFLMVILL